MCGIYATNINFSKQKIKSKLKLINYRGPDYMGITQENNLSFGHLRLSIIDLDIRSNQPMAYDNYIIVFNGEIYNFKDIRDELITLGYNFNTNGDTEVILKGYKEWGSSVVKKLNGMFAFVIYDKESNKIFCSRDRIGVKPFFYYYKDGFFEICSQLGPISENRTVNYDAVKMYLSCTYVPSPYSIYQDIYKLQPGHNLTIDITNNNSIEIEEYWNLKNIEPSKLSYSEAVDKTHDLLVDAVRIRLNSDVPIGTFLSGGIDSALVTSIASNLSNKEVKSFVIGFEDPKYDESKTAEKFANIIGSDHKEIICKADDVLEMIPKFIDTYDEPFGDSSALPSLLLNQVTKPHVTVALSGDGGDESFLGYNHFDWVYKFNMIRFVPLFIRKLLSKLLPNSIPKNRKESIKRILNIKTKFDFIEGIFVGYNPLIKNRNLNWLKNYSSYKKWSNNNYQMTADLSIKLWLENDSNVKVDRASMASSVEVRSPFLDYRLIEFARTLPISYRYIKGNKKRILKDILSRYIPKEIFNLPKKGFSIPINNWIRHELKNEFETTLSDTFLSMIPDLNVNKFKEMFSDHMDNKADYSSYIWRMYVLAKWFQKNGVTK